MKFNYIYGKQAEQYDYLYRAEVNHDMPQFVG